MAEMGKCVDLSYVLNLRAWTPLLEVCEKDTKLVMEGVYEVAPNIYLRTQRYNQNLEEGDVRAPFITMAYWAPSIECLQRIVLNDPSFKAVESKSPPFELSSGTNGMYSELSEKIISTNERCAEKATYSNLGLFVKRVISIGRFSYCFASCEDVDERAFAVEVALVR
jgi:hypothetical protein